MLLLGGCPAGPAAPAAGRPPPLESPPGVAGPAGPPSGTPTRLPDPDPAIDALDPLLAERFRAAQEAAAADGVELTLTSGRRTVEEQEQLVADALDRYGDPDEAHRWVLPPDRSAHVQGRAVDVGPTAGAYWLVEHAPDLGLCSTYANEPWHFELPPDGTGACPEPHPDSSWGW
ncbi:M15 family metallopeptidase [Cellulomonas endometrii]|uniref:M15 family metallopeptidase n=1 Tax=Cellulomonas endometrii TaxID=3036301 RepID=UPI0031F9DB52